MKTKIPPPQPPLSTEVGGWNPSPPGYTGGYYVKGKDIKPMTVLEFIKPNWYDEKGEVEGITHYREIEDHPLFI